GWYRRVINKLRTAGLVRAQKSMYSAYGIPTFFYLLIRELALVPPASCFATTIQAIQMYAIPEQGMILTDAFQLGGYESLRCLGPVPAELDVADVGLHPAGNPPLPPYVQNNPMNPDDWVVCFNFILDPAPQCNVVANEYKKHRVMMVKQKIDSCCTSRNLRRLRRWFSRVVDLDKFGGF
ncbi:hypothetical protein CALVIDRAFT_532139, partial [Calocera viscosa TUFC12733]